MKSLSLALPLNFLSLKIERQLFVSIFEEWDQIKNTFWDYPTFTYFKTVTYQQYSTHDAYLPSVISKLSFYDIVLLHVHFATFFSNFCTWVLGAHIFQGTNTHSLTHRLRSI